MEIMEIEENGEKTGIQLVLLNVHDRNKLQVFITFLSGYRLCTTLARIKYLNSYWMDSQSICYSATTWSEPEPTQYLTLMAEMVSVLTWGGPGKRYTR